LSSYGRSAGIGTTSAARQRSYAVAHDEVALPIVASFVDQFHEGAGRIGGVDDDLDGEVAIVSMKRSFRKMPDLPPRASENARSNNV